MIISFKHKGLEKFFATGNVAGIQAHHAKRLRLLLAALNTAEVIEDMHLPGYKLHSLKGALLGRWSITVNANWRMTFEFVDGNVHVLDYKDSH